MRSKNIVVFLFWVIGSSATAQTQCNFAIDTFRIVRNLDLDSFLSKFGTEKFTTFQKKENIPTFVMDELDCLTGGFSLGESDGEWQCCCTSSHNLPKRKLLFLAISRDIVAMTYLTGGVGVCTHILFIQFGNDKIEKIWTTEAFPELKSKKEIVSYIRKSRHKNGGLNLYCEYL